MHSPPSSHLVLLLQGLLANGQAYWAYLKLPAVRAKAFHEAKASGAPVDPEAFGEIIAWGEGERVPPAIMERMEREHGVNHQLQQALRKR